MTYLLFLLLGQKQTVSGLHFVLFIAWWSALYRRGDGAVWGPDTRRGCQLMLYFPSRLPYSECLCRVLSVRAERSGLDYFRFSASHQVTYSTVHKFTSLADVAEKNCATASGY